MDVTLPADLTKQVEQELAALPVFGYPGWLAGNDRAEFYDDVRYFRPFRREPPQGKAGKRVS